MIRSMIRTVPMSVEHFQISEYGAFFNGIYSDKAALVIS